jgi:hypothetical protein
MENDKFLYKEFRVNKKIYNLNVGYWKKKLISKLNIKFSNENQYVKNKKPDGKSFYDGNPIFTYYENKHAYRIIQENPDEIGGFDNVRLIDAWFDKVYLYNNENPVSELVVSLYLTRETVEKCIELIKLFRLGKLDEENLENNL